MGGRAGRRQNERQRRVAGGRLGGGGGRIPRGPPPLECALSACLCALLRTPSSRHPSRPLATCPPARCEAGMQRPRAALGAPPRRTSAGNSRPLPARHTRRAARRGAQPGAPVTGTRPGPGHGGHGRGASPLRSGGQWTRWRRRPSALCAPRRGCPPRPDEPHDRRCRPADPRGRSTAAARRRRYHQ